MTISDDVFFHFESVVDLLFFHSVSLFVSFVLSHILAPPSLDTDI